MLTEVMMMRLGNKGDKEKLLGAYLLRNRGVEMFEFGIRELSKDRGRRFIQPS